MGIRSTIASVAVWAVLAPLAVVLAVGIVYVVTPRAAVVYEDEPGWNCATMGNRVCGPVGVAWEGVAQDDYATCAYWDGWSEPECVVAALGTPGETLRDTMTRLGY